MNPDTSSSLRGAVVIVVSFNSAQYVRACLRSLIDHRADYDIVLHDNASTDGSAEIADEFSGEVQVVRGKENLGFAGALNAAVATTGHPIILALNPDTTVGPAWAEQLTEALRGNVAASTPLICLQDGRTVNACGNNIHIGGITTCRFLGASATDPKVMCPSLVPAISGAAFAVTREAWIAAGGMQASYFLYLEDTEFSIRLRLLGYDIAYVPSSVIWHDYRPRFTADKFRLLERNRSYMLRSCFTLPILVALSPALFVLELLSWLMAFRLGMQGLVMKSRSAREAFSTDPTLRKRRESLRVRDQYRVLESMDWRLDVSQLGGTFVRRIIAVLLDPIFFLARAAALRVAFERYRTP
jgi:GT2 family glycosyltransferase